MKNFRAVTPSLRGTVMIDRSGLHKGGSFKLLTEGGGYRAFGRTGKISAWKKGGGVKRKYRLIDFKRLGAKGEVLRIEYDPNRTAFIALLKHHDQATTAQSATSSASTPAVENIGGAHSEVDGIAEEKGVIANLNSSKFAQSRIRDGHSYVLAPEGVKVGDILQSGSGAPIKAGNCLPMIEIPVGTVIHNIEMKRGKGGQIARSAGCSATLLSKAQDVVLVKLTSGEVRKIDAMCVATIGVLSNQGNKNVSIGKAGRSRKMGRRPTVRGVAMNPIDHPHGGGEGKTSGGKDPRDPWGRRTKGLKTRRNTRSDSMIVRRRSKSK